MQPSVRLRPLVLNLLLGAVATAAPLLPDLVVVDFVEQAHQVHFTLRNQGGATAPAGHVAALYVAGQRLDTRNIPKPLAPGASLSSVFLKFYWNCTQDGSAVLRVTADDTGQVTESNETNNTRTETWICDVTPPQILTGPEVSQITSTSARVRWTTDEASDSEVSLGTHPQKLSLYAASTKRTTTHVVTLANLQPGTLYYYQAASRDDAGNTVRSPVGSFRTEVLRPDLQVARIWRVGPRVWVRVENHGLGTAAAGHVTELRVNGVVRDTNTVTVPLPPGAGAKGSFPAYDYTCAESSTTVHVTADSTDIVDESNETNNSLTETWTCDPLRISAGPEVTDIDLSTAHVRWTTNRPADSTVFLGRDPEQLVPDRWSPERVTEHDLVISGLSPGDTFYVQVASADAEGATVQSEIVSFVTAYRLPDLQISRIWRVGPRVWYRVENHGAATAPAGHVTRLTVGGVVADTNTVPVDLAPGQGAKGSFPGYAFACVGASTVMQVAADADETVDELDETNNSRPAIWLCAPPLAIIDGPEARKVLSTSASIVWTTNRPADGSVQYDTTAGTFGMKRSHSADVEKHALSLTSLRPGTVYAYRVVSTDPNGETVTSKPAFFQTAPRQDTLAPRIKGVQIERDPGPDPIYHMRADAEDDQRVDHVIFYLDGRVLRTDYSEPFEAVIAPGILGTAWAEFFQEHTLAAEAVDASLHVSERWPGLFEPPHECADIEAEFVFPYPPSVIYVPADPVPAGTLQMLTIHGARVERTYHEAYDEMGRPHGHFTEEEFPLQEVRYYANTADIGTVLPDLADPSFNHRYRLDWDLGGWRAGDYHLRVDAVADDDCIQTLTWDTRIEVGAPRLTCQRRVWREGNSLVIELVVRNLGTVAFSCAQVVDSLEGLQPLDASEEGYAVVSGATSDGRAQTVTLDAGPTGTYEIEPGRTLSITYRVIPTQTPSPGANRFRIGEDPVAVYAAAGGDPCTFDLPGRITEDGETLATAVAAAIAAADYLIVTNPERAWLQFGPADALLQALARFAHESRGVLGYLSGPAATDPVWCSDAIRGWGATMTGADGTAGHFLDNGFLLLVGENEIVPGHTVDISNITWTDGSTTTDVPLSDLPYADVRSADTVPELNTGRIIGNTMADLIAALQTGLDARSSFDRSFGVVTSGSEGEWEPFVPNAREIADTWAAEASSGKAMGDGQRSPHWTAYIHKEQGVSGYAFNKATDEAMVMADLDGTGPVLVSVVPTDDRAYVWPHGSLDPSRSVPAWNFACPFDPHDGLAAGDLDGDGDDEIVVASRDDDTITVVYGLDGATPQVEATFDAGDVLACGHGPWGGGVREWAMVARAARGGTIDQYELFYDGTWHVYRVRSLEEVPFDDDWGFAVGDVDTTAAGDELIISRVGENRLSVYNDGGLFVADIPCDPVTRYDALQVGDFDADGAAEMGLLIDDTVDHKRRLKVFQNDCWQQNAAGDWEIKGGQAATIFSRFLHFEGALTTGDSRSDAVACGDLDGDGREELLLARQTDGRLYVLDGYYARGWMSRFLPVIQGLAPDADVFTVIGHGSPASCSPFRTGEINSLALSSHPLGLGLTCLSGNYEGLWAETEPNGTRRVHGPADGGFAEAFLGSGAAAYIGATQVSGSTPNTEAGPAFFNGWARDESAAQALTQLKRSRVTDSSMWRFWCTEYNFYGDAKFGRMEGPGTAPAPRLWAAAPPTSPGTTWTYDPKTGVLDIHVPDYTIETTADTSRLRIPGAESLVVEGRPLLPLVRIELAIDPNLGRPEVTVLSRKGLSTEIGPALDLANMAPPREGYTGSASPPVTGWFPAEPLTVSTIDNGPRGTTLVIRLAPVLYDSLTHEIRFHRDWRLRLGVPDSPVRLGTPVTDAALYRVGQPVHVSVSLRGRGEPSAPILAVTIRRYGTDAVLAGLDLRRLLEVTGPSTLNLTWDSTGAEPGTCTVEVTLADLDGTVWQRRTQRFGLAEDL